MESVLVFGTLFILPKNCQPPTSFHFVFFTQALKDFRQVKTPKQIEVV